MSTSASRCDQIIALIDACLAEFDGSSGAGSSQHARHIAAGVSGSWSPTHSPSSR